MIRIAPNIILKPSKQQPCFMRSLLTVTTGSQQRSKANLNPQNRFYVSAVNKNINSRNTRGGEKTGGGGYGNKVTFGLTLAAFTGFVKSLTSDDEPTAPTENNLTERDKVLIEKPPIVKKELWNDQIMSLDQFKKGQVDRTWVAYDKGIYDVTEFLDAHPGGPARIMMVQGQDLAKFWDIYKLHDREHIKNLLEEYRIGKLSVGDYKMLSDETIFTSSYETDPPRPAAKEGKLRIPSEQPWNSEPKNLSQLVETFLTPNDIFFVRNHNPVPVLTEDDYELEVGDNPEAGIKGRTFTLADLKKLPRYEMISALQCAGNRQEDYVTEDRPLYVAPHWRNGAIGCAVWAGVKVRDVLRECGLDVDDIALGKKTTNMKIANFIAYDQDETAVQYAGVVPLHKIIDPFGDAILAYEMNGETLPRDHGYPIRLLAPGTAGCRNVKWVQSIEISEEPSELDSGGRLDRHLAPDISWDLHREHAASERNGTVPSKDTKKHHDPCAMRDVLTETSPVIQTLPVQSVICVPGNRETLSAKSDSITVKGVAWSGAGRGICRVEISTDNGKTFTAAELKRGKGLLKEGAPPPELGLGRNYAWTQWELKVPIPDELKNQLKRGDVADLEICCKAIDGDFNVQPEKMRHGWNVLGVCVNHWSRIQVKLDPNLPPGKIISGPATPKPGAPYWGDGSVNKP